MINQFYERTIQLIESLNEEICLDKVLNTGKLIHYFQITVPFFKRQAETKNYIKNFYDKHNILHFEDSFHEMHHLYFCKDEKLNFNYLWKEYNHMIVNLDLNKKFILFDSNFISVIKKLDSTYVFLKEIDLLFRNLLETIPTIHTVHGFFKKKLKNYEESCLKKITYVTVNILFPHNNMDQKKRAFEQIEFSDEVLSDLKASLTVNDLKPINENYQFLKMESFDEIFDHLFHLIRFRGNRMQLSENDLIDILSCIKKIDLNRVIAIYRLIKPNEYNIFKLLTKNFQLTNSFVQSIIKNKKFINENEFLFIMNQCENIDKKQFVEFLLNENIEKIPLHYIQKQASNEDKIRYFKILSKNNPKKALTLLKHTIIEDEKIAFEIIWLLMSKGVNAAQLLKTMHISNPHLRYKLASLWAVTQMSKTKKDFENFNLECRENERFEILEMLSKNNPQLAIEIAISLDVDYSKKIYFIIDICLTYPIYDFSSIHSLFITVERKYEIALVQLNLNLEYFIRNLSFFFENSNDPKKFEIIWDYIKKHYQKYSVINFLNKMKYFKLEEKYQLKILYFFINKSKFENVLQSFMIHDLSDENLYKVINYFCLKINEKNIVNPISVFSIPFNNTVFIKKVALNFAHLSCFSISETFCPTIFSEKEKECILWARIQLNPEEVLSFIQNYEITPLETKVKIAEALLLRGLDISEHIKNFAIDDETEKLKLLDLQFQSSNGISFLKVIQNYEISDENIRYHYYKLWVDWHFENNKKIPLNKILDLNLSQNHFHILLERMLPNLSKKLIYLEKNEGILRFYPEDQRLGVINRLMELHNFKKIPIVPNELTQEQLVYVINTYIQKKDYDAVRWILYVEKNFIESVYEMFLEALKVKLNAVLYLRHFKTNNQKMREISQAIAFSMGFTERIHDEQMVVKIANIYFSQNEFKKFSRELIFNKYVCKQNKRLGELNNRLYSTMHTFSFFKKFNELYEISTNFQEKYTYNKVQMYIPGQFVSVLNHMENDDNITRQEKTFKFLLSLSKYYYFCINFKSDFNNNENIKKIIFQLIALRNPKLKIKLLNRFFLFYHHNQSDKNLSKLKELLLSNNSKAFLFVLFSQSYSHILNADFIEHICRKVSKNRAFIKDRTFFTTFLEKIHSLLALSDIDVEKIWKFIDTTLSKSSYKKIVEEIAYAETMLILDKNYNLDSEDKDIKTPINLIREKLNIFELSKQEFFKKYEATFMKYSDPNALIKYLASNNFVLLEGHQRYLADDNLFETASAEFNHLLAEHIRQVFYGTYREKRYCLKTNQHLAEVFNKRPKAYECWKENMELEVSDLIPPENHLFEKSHYNFRELFESLILDKGRISLEVVKKDYPEMYHVLTQKKSPDSAIQELRGQLNRDSSAENKLHFQIHLLELLSIQYNTDEILDKLLILKGLIKKKEGLYSDIVSLIATIKNKSNFIPSRYAAVLTDDPERILLMGDDVKTCQQTNSPSKINRGLLGPLLDGKYRLAIIYHKESKKVMARALLRMMIDIKTNEGVIFRETVYTNVDKPRLIQALNQLCIHLSQKMELPLLTAKKEWEDVNYLPYPNPVCSLGGPSSVEYVDALKKNESNTYVIKNTIQIS